MLLKRIVALERRLESRPRPMAEEPSPETIAAFRARWTARAGEIDRRKTLPLEEQLLLLRADHDARCGERRNRPPRPDGFVLAADEPGGSWDLCGETFIRELEIAILERDNLIDARTAEKLRENASNHVRFRADLMEIAIYRETATEDAAYGLNSSAAAPGVHTA